MLFACNMIVLVHEGNSTIQDYYLNELTGHNFFLCTWEQAYDVIITFKYQLLMLQNNSKLPF
jgi:hypothetical protein